MLSVDSQFTHGSTPTPNSTRKMLSLKLSRRKQQHPAKVAISSDLLTGEPLNWTLSGYVSVQLRGGVVSV